MTDENDARHKTAREEFEQARERYHEMRQQERDQRRQERDAERGAHREERERAREERRSLRDEIRRSLHSSLGTDLGHHIGRTIRDSMSFNVDLGDVDAGGDEYSETLERDFTVGRMPRRKVRIEAHTVSGDLELAGTRGPLDTQSVSGDVRLEDVQGPLRLKTVSGDGTLVDYAGQLVANTVSGDLSFERVRLHGSEIITVSGEIRIDGELDKARDHRFKTISGDVDLRLTGGSYDIRFSSMSGDLDSDMKGE